MLLDPFPLSQTVTPSRTPSTLERDVLYGRPLFPVYYNVLHMLLLLAFASGFPSITMAVEFVV